MEIRKHNHLEPKIWTTNNTLYPESREMFLSIAWAFIDNVRCRMGLEIYNSDVKDIFVYGSIANYFYNKKSDVDICILLDMDSVKAKNPERNVEQDLTMFYYNWAMTHHCNIYGRKVDISYEKVNSDRAKGHYRTGAMYSLIKNDWIYAPVIISDAEFHDITSKAKSIYKKIVKDYKVVKKNGFIRDEIETLYKNIYHSKNTAHDENITQPVTPMYIAFRKVRNRGIIDRLQQEAIKKESAEFVLK